MQDFRESQIKYLLDDILLTAQDFLNAQDDEDLGEISIDEAAAILYDMNKSCAYEDAIVLLKKLLSSYDAYSKCIEDLDDKYEVIRP